LGTFNIIMFIQNRELGFDFCRCKAICNRLLGEEGELSIVCFFNTKFQ
jgi:hypothetical protein